MTNYAWPAPRVGQIVLARFPYSERAGQPGPKPRPCLITAVLPPVEEKGPLRVQICYGTGQKQGQPAGPCDLDIAPRDGPGFALAGLLEQTRFQLDNHVVVEYTPRWFEVPRSRPHGLTPKLGALDRKLYKAPMARAAQAAGLI